MPIQTSLPSSLDPKLSAEAAQIVNEASVEMKRWIDDSVSNLAAEMNKRLDEAAQTLEAQAQKLEQEYAETITRLSATLTSLNTLKTAELANPQIKEAVAQTIAQVEGVKTWLAQREERWRELGRTGMKTAIAAAKKAVAV
jgi:hypothetical protein